MPSLTARRYFFLFFTIILFTSLSADAQLIPSIIKNEKKKDSVKPTEPQPINTNSDSLGFSITNTLENYTTSLNRDMSLLRRGFDTSEIARELPVMEDVLVTLKRNIDSKSERMNLRNLFSYQVALQQIDKQAEGHQQKLLNFSKQLNDIRTDIRNIKDADQFNISSDDSIMLEGLLQQVKPLMAKKALVDSMQRQAQRKIGVLQNRATAAFLQGTELLDAVNGRIRNLQSQFVIRDQPYIWNARPMPEESSLKEMIKEEFSRNRRVIDFYYSLNLVSIFVLLSLTLLFYFFARYNYRRLKATGAMGWNLPMPFVNRSILGSVLLVLFTFTPYVLQNPPAGIVQFAWLLMLLTATYLRWNDWNDTFRKYWIGIILFFIVYAFDNFLLSFSFTERILLLVLNILAIALSVIMYLEVRKDRKRYHILMDESILLFMISNFLALVMNVSGRFALSKVLSNSSALSVALLLALQVIKDILFEFIYLIAEANKKSRFYSYFAVDRVKESFKGVLNLATFIIWILAFAWSMNFNDIVIERTKEFLSKERALGEMKFTFISILIFLFLIWVSLMLGRLITILFSNTRAGGSTTAKKQGSWLLIIRLVIYTVGFLIAIGAAGIPLDKLTIVLGALSVGIGFGLQTITNNLISGIILAFERPIQVGDIIDLGTRTGTVKEIGIRSSKISMFDGSDVIVPNGDLLSQHLVNWTHDDQHKRNELIIGVAYGTDLTKAIKLISDSLQDKPGLMKNPAPVILVHEFAQSSVNLRVFFWATEIGEAAALKSSVMASIYEQFSTNGIEIPFPQTDLHIRSMDAKAMGKFASIRDADEADDGDDDDGETNTDGNPGQTNSDR
ncbi:mechanosensitive ion channel family protein [Pollutibacter soli]|uniref:mechanosensitive ion channel family protein n=1 Tax=Pollutibacter soli TaxID=3034157 RepID=UPI0030134392